MKTVTSTTIEIATTMTMLAGLLLALSPSVAAAQKLPSAKLLDMYAVKEGESYVVHVLANGDISSFLSDRTEGERSYRLTLDVPALGPMDSRYDVQTPFSRRFQVWPMQLGKAVYSRIEIELDGETSSVVGLENASHLFVRIQGERVPPAAVTATDAEPTDPKESEDAPEAPPIELPMSDGGTASAAEKPEASPLELVEEPAVESKTKTETETETETATETETDVSSLDAGPNESPDERDEELFYSLFPTPAPEQRTLFNVATEDTLAEETALGIRLGRFLAEPSVDFSMIRGDNLLLQSEGPFVDTGYLLRGRVKMTLLESVHDVEITYEGRYRDFEKFELEDRFTSFVDFSSRFEMTPRSTATVENHFVYGAFESGEFDPGGEVVASTDPFYRNYTRGVVGLELSERLGMELNASFNRVEFLNPSTDFFSYDTRELGGTFLYDLSAVTRLLGEYVRIGIPASPARPVNESTGDMVLFGLRGEITPLLRGQARIGYASQRFVSALVPQDFSGFVADVDMTRDFGERAALTVRAGRRTSLSAFEANSYYVSNYGRFQFITPIGRSFRLTATAALFGNDYPVAILSETERSDSIFSGAAGLAYFFTPISFLSFDYRHDRRSSSLEELSYRNHAFQLMVGFGFLNR